MEKKKAKLSKEDQVRVDQLLGVIAGAKKELGLIFGRTLGFEKAPKFVSIGLPSKNFRAASLDDWEEDFEMFCSEDGVCGIHDDATGTCYEV